MVVFSVDVAFAYRFVSPHHPHPFRSAYGIGYASKNYLEWQVIQLIIHSIVGVQTDYE